MDSLDTYGFVEPYQRSKNEGDCRNSVLDSYMDDWGYGDKLGSIHREEHIDCMDATDLAFNDIEYRYATPPVKPMDDDELSAAVGVPTASGERRGRVQATFQRLAEGKAFSAAVSEARAAEQDLWTPPPAFLSPARAVLKKEQSPSPISPGLRSPEVGNGRLTSAGDPLDQSRAIVDEALSAIKSPPSGLKRAIAAHRSAMKAAPVAKFRGLSLPPGVVPKPPSVPHPSMVPPNPVVAPVRSRLSAGVGPDPKKARRSAVIREIAARAAAPPPRSVYSDYPGNLNYNSFRTHHSSVGGTGHAAAWQTYRREVLGASE